jgi:SAM-dependent methyltransferase
VLLNRKSEIQKGLDMDEAGCAYYRRDLALVHHLGFGFHAAACAPGILALLEPVRQRGGLVVELGCGSGLLTRHLLTAGHRVIATDASSAMLDLAREHAVGAQDICQVVLPDDPIPAADAIVSVGHVLNYLADERAVDQALAAAARALRPGGVFAIDLCDLQWGRSRLDCPTLSRVTEDWAVVTAFCVSSPNRFIRNITVFSRNHDGSWRRDDERHENVLINTARVPAFLLQHGVEVSVGSSFGTERLPTGLVAVTGHRPP